jgi:hypothetical protein
MHFFGEAINQSLQELKVVEKYLVGSITWILFNEQVAPTHQMMQQISPLWDVSTI